MGAYFFMKTQVKIITETDSANLEFYINKFISDYRDNQIVDIKYNTIVIDSRNYEIIYSALITYKIYV